MKHTSRLRFAESRYARPAFAAGVALASTLGLIAQTAATTESTEEPLKLEKFVVTGSAIPTPEGETFSPVTVYSPGQMARAGAALPIEVVRAMPGFQGAVATEQRSNGGSGAAGVNLRGLAGTITLLEGKATASFGNFNLLPFVALERVEIVKDGAGAVYGASALSGVFNIFLTPRFEGAKVDVYYGNTTEADAGVLRYGAIAGGSWGKFDAVVAFESYQRNALHSIDRDPSNTADQRFRGGINGGSGSFSGRATARRGSATAPIEDLVLAPGKTIGLTASDFVTFDTQGPTSNQFLNFRQYTPSIPKQERYNVYGRVNWKPLPNVDAYARLLYAHEVFYNGLAPSPMPSTGTAGTALRNAVRLSPHIPTGFFIQDTSSSPIGAIQNGTVPFRTIALGPRTQTFTRDAWDFTAGLKGTFGEDWQWNLDYVYSVFYRDDVQAGAPGRAALVSRILSGAYNPWALDTVSGTGPTGVAFDNPKALRESAAGGKTDNESPSRGFLFGMSGTAFTIPSGDVKLGFGGDYYRVDSATVPEPIFFSGDLLGLNSSNPTISRGYGAGAFAELQIPLVAEQWKWPFVKSVALSLSGRYDYQTVEGYQNGTSGAAIGKSFTAHNPKVGLRWQVDDDLMIRATWGTGFRLPSLGALFAAPGTSFPQLRDPLGFPIANQTQISTSGNPNLSPEDSKTYSAGFVWSPKFAPGLSIVADYYYGTIKGLVGEGSQFIVNINAAGQGPGFVAGNAATLNPNAPFANLITRSPTGSITTVASTNFNISARETTGVDFGITYAWPWKSWGRWTSRLDWNTVLSWDLTPVPGQAKQSFVGVYLDTSNNAISPGSIPKNKGQLSQLWEKGNWAVVFTGNYISELQDDPNFALIPGTTTTGFVRYIEEWVTFDTQVEFELPAGDGWKKWLAGTTIRVGANNVFDEKAPFSAGAFNDGYDVTTHSNRGRFVYTQITKKF